MKRPRFLTVCLNPVVQKTILLSSLRENEVNRSSRHYLDAGGKGLIVSRVLAALGEESVHLTHAGGWNRKLFLSLARSGAFRVAAPHSGSEVRFCTTLVDEAVHRSTEIV